MCFTTLEGASFGAMENSPAPRNPKFARVEPSDLARRLASKAPPLVLDIRRLSTFGAEPGIAGAIPLALDRDPLLLPDVSRARPIVAYCL